MNKNKIKQHKLKAFDPLIIMMWIIFTMILAKLYTMR